MSLPRPRSEIYRVVLQTIFDVLLETADWPTFRVLDRRLHNQGIQFDYIDKSGFTDLMFGSRLDMPIPAHEQMRLTFAGVAACRKSEPVVELFLRIVQLAVSVEDKAPESSSDDPMLTEEMVLSALAPAISRDTLRTVLPLLVLEPWGHMGSYVGENGWAFTLSSRLRRFAGKTSPEAYWDQRQSLFTPAVQLTGEGTLSVGRPAGMASVSSLVSSSALPDDSAGGSSLGQTSGDWGRRTSSEGAAEGTPANDPDSAFLDTQKSPNAPSVSAITSDRLDGPDQLGVTKDAQALAALIASRRLSPPFAVAVYGPWGTGKSFFMEQIHSQVARFAAADADLFHHRIRQVRFSAWHYAETNLWASLLYHIFQELARVSDDTEDFLRVVMEDVESAQVVVHAVEAQLDAASTAVLNARQRLENAEKKYAETQAELEKLDGRDLWETLKDLELDEDQKAAVNAAMGQLGIEHSDGSVKELRANLSTLIGLASDSRRLSTVGGPRSPLAVGTGVGLAISAGVVLLALVAHPGSKLHTVVATGIGEFVAAGSALAAWTARCGGLLERIMTPARALQARIDQRLEAARAKHEVERAKLHAELEGARRDSTVLRGELTEARRNLAQAQAELTSLTGARLLERFLSERATSNDYRQYLGLVGLAHRDLVSLGRRMERALGDHGPADTVIDRIVLYIDDLDRCSTETVSQVLDAVHLLLALPLFAVVVGVDPRWLARSLATERPALNQSEADDYATIAGPGEFLEKIFHLTYTLPVLTAQGVVNLVRAQMSPATGETAETSEQTDDRAAALLSVSDDEEDTGRTVPTPRRTEATPTPHYQDAAEIAVAVTLTEHDIATLEDVAPILARSPRKVMRFYNILAVVRASVTTSPTLVERIKTEAGAQELLLTVALMTSLPPELRLRLAEPADDSTTVKSWLAGLSAENQHARETVGSLLMRATAGLETPLANLRQWIPHVLPWVSV